MLDNPIIYIAKNHGRDDKFITVIWFIHLFLIEYRSIPGASTISLSFWLSWSFDMVSRTSVTKRSRVRISSTPPCSVEYFAPGMREAYATSTLQAQRVLTWGGVIEYRSIPGASTINLSFWLSWSFDTLYSISFNSFIWMSSLHTGILYF